MTRLLLVLAITWLPSGSGLAQDLTAETVLVGPVSSGPILGDFLDSLAAEAPGWTRVSFRPPRLSGGAVIDRETLIGPLGERLSLEIHNADPDSPATGWTAAGARLDGLLPELGPDWIGEALPGCPAGRRFSVSEDAGFPEVPRAREYRAVAWCPLGGSRVAVLSFSSLDGFPYVDGTGPDLRYVQRHVAAETLDAIAARLVGAYSQAAEGRP